MKTDDFLKQFGEITDTNVRFISAGNTVIVPVAELLEKYLAVNAPKPKTKK